MTLPYNHTSAPAHVHICGEPVYWHERNANASLYDQGWLCRRAPDNAAARAVCGQGVRRVQSRFES